VSYKTLLFIDKEDPYHYLREKLRGPIRGTAANAA